MSAFSTAQVSRKLRQCSCGGWIGKGDRYLSHVATPSHEGLGNPRWWRISECAACARRYGRGPLLDGLTVAEAYMARAEARP